MPDISLDQALTKAETMHRAGQLREAESLYRQILSARPNHAGALHYLGVIAHQAGNSKAALDLIQRSLRIDPSNGHAWTNLGLIYIHLGQLQPALEAVMNAGRLNTASHEWRFTLCDVLSKMNRIDEAIAALQQAIAIDPSRPQSYNNLANLLLQRGRISEAIKVFQAGIRKAPDVAYLRNNFGQALKDVDRFQEAADEFSTAIRIDPQWADPYNNLACVIKQLNRQFESPALYRKAIELDPTQADIKINYASTLRDEGLLDASEAAWRRVLQEHPDSFRGFSQHLLTLLCQPASTPESLAREHAEFNRRYAQPLAGSIRPHANDRSPDRPLRIGYVSPDFRGHVVGRNMIPLFREHEHKNFQIICYYNVDDDDAYTKQFKSYADIWRAVSSLSDDQLAGQIREDRIDILVDLSLHTMHNRLLVFARKPAPVQVTFAGYPGTTGLTAIDYRLTDPYLDPPGEFDAFYSEQSFRLPHSFWCYDPVAMGASGSASGGASGDVAPSPTGPITFCCLNHFPKANPQVLQLWSRVMGALPDSRLILLAPIGPARQRVLEHFQSIDPARIEFTERLSQPDYFRLFSRIDICLDTFPYNGHTTSLDAYWMGVPVVTLVGKTTCARAGFSQLSNLKLTKLAASTPDEFVEIAVGLASNRDRLAELRSTLRQCMQDSPICDAKGFARGIEAAYRQMWQRWVVSP